MTFKQLLDAKKYLIKRLVAIGLMEQEAKLLIYGEQINLWADSMEEFNDIAWKLRETGAFVEVVGKTKYNDIHFLVYGGSWNEEQAA